MENPLTSLSVAQLKRAVAIKERIQKLEKKLGAIIGAPGSAPAEGRVIRRRRKMSAEARAKISAAQRARWAKQKAGKK
jgi:hypothetical protein